jgi:hypothetical protein
MTSICYANARELASSPFEKVVIEPFWPFDVLDDTPYESRIFPPTHYPLYQYAVPFILSSFLELAVKR